MTCLGRIGNNPRDSCFWHACLTIRQQRQWSLWSCRGLSWVLVFCVCMCTHKNSVSVFVQNLKWSHLDQLWWMVHVLFVFVVNETIFRPEVNQFWLSAVMCKMETFFMDASGHTMCIIGFVLSVHCMWFCNGCAVFPCFSLNLVLTRKDKCLMYAPCTQTDFMCRADLNFGAES